MAKRVLIVDDAGFMRSLLKDILTDEGFEVVGQATDGQMGVDMYQELRPDLVTMDVNMPKLDGRDALEAILKVDATARVVMVTTAGQDEIIKRTLIAGARDFIIKPFKKHQVVQTINRIIKDNGTPQSFMEELVSWYELGEILLRSDLITQEVLTARREEVKRGEHRNLFEAFQASGEVMEDDLRDAFEAGHKEVSMAFLLMKTKVVTMTQLRCAFVMMRKTNKKLGFTLMELGFCDKDAVAEAMKLVPPSRFTSGV
jgi:two-component system, chemotaxis family, chemotaxis protein CheY